YFHTPALSFHFHVTLCRLSFQLIRPPPRSTLFPYTTLFRSHRAGVLESSFVAEVKSDLMGEQTILCGMLQAGSLICYDKLVADGKDPAYAAQLVQFGWETITEALKLGGITLMMDRLSNSAKLRAFELSEQIKAMLTPLFQKHMDDIISGEFSRVMMEDWA